MKFSSRRVESNISSGYEQCRNLHTAIFPGEAWECRESVLWVVTEPGGYPVAYAALDLWESGICFLSSCGVRRKARGHGLQKRLIRTREKFAKLRDKLMVVTYTTANNYPSLTNLVRCGYNPFDPEYPWVGRDGIIYYRKEL